MKDWGGSFLISILCVWVYIGEDSHRLFHLVYGLQPQRARGRTHQVRCKLPPFLKLGPLPLSTMDLRQAHSHLIHARGAIVAGGGCTWGDATPPLSEVELLEYVAVTYIMLY